MRLKFSALMLGAALAAMATAADARAVKWARAADALTLDPHGQNEGPTIAFNGQVYEALITRDNSNKLVPALATSWKLVDPTTWEFKLRPNVKFHNGDAFTADDVVFSFQRALQPTSDYKGYLANTKEVVKVDDLTVQLKTNGPNPLVPDNLTTVYVMSKKWAEANNATKPQDFKNKEENFAVRNANGTGPFVLVSREPDVKTVVKRNDAYWGRGEVAARDHRADAHHHQAGRDPRRRAALRRSRRRAGRAGAGYRAAEGLAEPARFRRSGEPLDLLRLRRGLEGARLIRREGQEPVRGCARAPGRERARSTARRSSAS